MSERNSSASGRPRKNYPVARGVAPPPGHSPPIGDDLAERIPVAQPQEPELLSVPETLAFEPELLPDQPFWQRPLRRRSLLVLFGQIVGVTAIVAGCMTVGWLWIGRSQVPAIVKTAPTPPVVVPPKAVPVPVEPKVEPPPPKSEPKPEPKTSPKTATNLTFTKDIKPILNQRCETCHGFMNKKKGGLDLRTLDAAFKGGASGPAVVSGDPAKSSLVERIADESMPPNGKKVPAADLEKIKQWIAGGAK